MARFATGLFYAGAVLLITLLAWRRSGNIRVAAGWERWQKNGLRGLSADTAVGCYLACYWWA